MSTVVPPLERAWLDAAVVPHGVLADGVVLRHHQLQALTWMDINEPPPLTTTAAVQHRGGLLLDNVGYGKTLDILAHVASQPASRRVEGHWGTMVVGTVVHTWTVEGERRLSDSAARRCVTVTTREQLEQWTTTRMMTERKDIVFVSYSTLKAYIKRATATGVNDGDNITHHRWLRVVLDEAHIIRNRKSKYHQTCAALVAYYRWVVTATVIYNSIDDVISLLRWVRAAYQQPAQLAATIHDSETVHTALCEQALRRDDADRYLQLPPRTDTVYELDFAACERRFYRALVMTGRRRVERLLGLFEELSTQREKPLSPVTTAKNKNEMNRARLLVLEWILRLRQAPVHPYLVIAGSERLAAMFHMAYRRRYATAADALAARRHQRCALSYEETLEMASQCLERYEDASADEDVAAYATERQTRDIADTADDDAIVDDVDPNDEFLDYVNEYRRTEMARAHKRRRTVSRQKRPSRDVTPVVHSDAMLSWLRAAQSTKYVHAARIIAEAMAAGEKVIVASRWVSSLQLFARTVCDAQHIGYCMFIGSVATARRAATIDEFQNDARKHVLLMTASMGESRTITAASRVVHLDQWWNPQMDRQTDGRVHRWGQQRESRIYYLRVRNTVESIIERIRANKLALEETAHDGVARAALRTANWVRDARENFEFPLQDDVAMEDDEDERQSPAHAALFHVL